MLGIYLYITGFKLVIKTLVHGYVLHTVYGSLYLLGAIWNSVTQLLLHLGKGRPKAENPCNAVEGRTWRTTSQHKKQCGARTDLFHSHDKGSFHLYIQTQGLDLHITEIYIISAILPTTINHLFFYHMLRHVDNQRSL